MDIERLKQKVIEENYPSDEELGEIRDVYREISDFVEEEFGLETHLAGSAGRGTCLKDDKDIDVFVLFPEDTSENEMEEKGLRIGKKVFGEFDGDYVVDYAEHPYTKGDMKGFEVEIIPCIDVEKGSIRSSVDRTPYHSEWVKDKLDREQRKDVVALKSFLKAQDLYGSSLKTRGFSGYLCEVLVGHFGSFEEVVRESRNWGRGELIDPEGHFEGDSGDFDNDHFMVIDPVDPERNVASVLSLENYAKYIYRCLKFTENPGMDFFRPEKVEVDKFELSQEVDDRSDIIVIEFEDVEELEDIVYPQMRKTLGRLENELEKKDFRLFESGFHVGEKTRIFFELDSVLPEIEIVEGPRIFHGEEHVKQFQEKYSNVFVEGDRLKAKTEREYTHARDFLKDFLSEGLEKKGIPSNVATKIRDYSFAEPLVEDEEWLKYLTKKLHLN